MYHLKNLPESHLVLENSISEYLWLWVFPQELPFQQHPITGQEAEQHRSPRPLSKAAAWTGSQPPPHLLLREHGETSYNYTNKV